ncbi:TPA: helix-turn-helix domain-containing protein [Burkholderia multivorans]|nr:helix-turn-helix transcriptional regulator [Burkholderia multivorans]
MTNNPKDFGDISAANLPDAFHIKDPRAYLLQFRKSLLKRLRNDKGLSVSEVSKATGVSNGEIERLEEGNVRESDMAPLYSLSDFYGIDYSTVLYIFKLAKRPQNDTEYKLAAYHDPKMDDAAQRAISDFLSKLKKDSK